MRLYLFLTIGSLLFSACQFEPNGENPLEVIFPELTDVPLRVGTDDDTVYVYHPEQALSYAFESDHRAIRSLAFSLNGREVYHESDPPATYGSLVIDWNGEGDGTYLLEAEVIAGSGTGSWADRNDLEFITVTYQWTLIRQTSAPVPSAITQVTRQEGRVHISWEPYARGDFFAYRLTRVPVSGPEVYDYEWHHSEVLAIIRDPSQALYVDSSYVGGQVAYVLETGVKEYTNGSESTDYLPSSRQAYTDVRSTFYNSQSDTPPARLSWSACRYPANFRRYYLYRRVYGLTEEYAYKPATLIATFDQVNDTTYEIEEPVFGGRVVYQLYTNEAYQPGVVYPYADEITSEPIMWGEAITPYSELRYVAATESLYLLNEKQVRRLNPITYQAYTEPFGFNPSAQVWFGVSPDGRWAYVADRDEIRRVDPLTLFTQQRYELTALTNKMNRVDRLWVTNDNRLVIEGTLTSQYDYSVVEGFDMNLAQTTGWLERTDRNAPTLISADGQYWVRGTDIYQVSGGNVRQTGSLDTDGDFTLHLLPSDSEVFVVVEDNQARLIRWQDGNTQQVITLNSPLTEPNIDTRLGYLGGLAPTDSLAYYDIYDLAAGELRQRVPVVGSDPETYNPARFSLHHNTLYSTRGSYLTLPF